MTAETDPTVLPDPDDHSLYRLRAAAAGMTAALVLIWFSTVESNLARLRKKNWKPKRVEGRCLRNQIL